MNISQNIHIVIIDDHPLFRDGLKSLFASEPDIEVIGEADDGDAGLEIIRTAQPDVVLLDIGIPGISGLEVCRQITAMLPEVKTIMLTMYKTDKYISKAFEAGAKGYILKQGAVDDLTMGIRAVFAGKRYICSDLMDTVLDKYTGVIKKTVSLELKSELSDREVEIIRLVTQGWENERIGAALYISPATVKTHRAHIMKKLDIHSAGNLVKYALKNGIIELE